MQKKKKLPRDANARIVGISTGQESPDLSAITGAQIGNPPIVSEEPKKNSAAVALRRRGGLKSGKARAEKLSTRKRKQIAAKAVSARWKVKKIRKGRSDLR